MSQSKKSQSKGGINKTSVMLMIAAVVVLGVFALWMNGFFESAPVVEVQAEEAPTPGSPTNPNGGARPPLDQPMQRPESNSEMPPTPA